MKRINEKVKDIVEVRNFQSLDEFSADPAATLAAYYFTDGTAELMVKWLDRLADLGDSRSRNFALAGYRGVGKSHFLATLAAIATQPELRSKISDGHVAAAAQALVRKRYTCVMVRRGTQESLLDELREAVSLTTGLEVNLLPDSVADLLSTAKITSGDLPVLVLVDTAMERDARVTRDDGALLSEIADAALHIDAFVGVALDDDIAGADGSNSTIVRTFTIDYLDQEHLYKVVDSFVFPKDQKLRPVLHDVYEYFREVMPTFKWSEQRFMSLYPLHPAILDVAPFVRLYVHNFALLRFAAEAGERILGRPANSLIALDEVFDSAEADLRKVDVLSEAFQAYDRLNSDVVAKIPVMQRLQAKLILKALLLLSLEGQGTTASEISSGMLIFDENDPQKAARTVEEIIRMFAAALPDDVRVVSDEGREVRYGLAVADKDDLNKALTEAAASVDIAVVDEMVHRAFHERYTDSTFYANDGNRKASMESSLHWRGGMRRGRVSWIDGGFSNAPEHDDTHDWEVVIDRVQENAIANVGNVPRAVWKPAQLLRDEIETIRNLHILKTDTTFREAHGDRIRGALHSHALLLDRIVTRIFIEDGLLLIDGFDYNLSEDARSASSLGALFSGMLEPLFESRYPQHPYFLQNLGLSEVATLVSDLYSGSRQRLTEVQQLAQTFGLPLGLVKLTEGVYYPASVEHLATQRPVQSIMAAIDGSPSAQIGLREIYSELKQPPLGLVREAQQLVMAAMVSQRMIEFVTSKGDRINHRSLDLKIIWDDIVGVARPVETAMSHKKLLVWAVTLTGDETIKTLDNPADIAKLNAGFAAFLNDWDSKNILNRFYQIPEEALNTRIWRSVGRASKTLGAASSAVRKQIDGKMSVEECLTRISEAFLDEIANFETALSEMNVVEAYLEGFEFRETVASYLDLSESTDDESIEGTRESLFSALVRFDVDPSEDLNRQIGYHWSKFNREFTDHFAQRHDEVMTSHKIQEELENVLRGSVWWTYSNLAQYFGRTSDASRAVEQQKQTLDGIVCRANTRSILNRVPFCKCGYLLSRHEEMGSSVAAFERSLHTAIAEIEAAIEGRRADIMECVGEISKSDDELLKKTASELSAHVRSGRSLLALNEEQLQLLEKTMNTLKAQSASDMNTEPDDDDDEILSRLTDSAHDVVLSIS